MKLEDISDAAALFGSNYRRLRRKVPFLPEKYETDQPITEHLEEVLSRHYGVAAFGGGKLLGYWTAYRIPQFHGNWRGAYAPEWAHGTVVENRHCIYSKLYAGICRKWIDDSCITHTLSFLASDRELKRFSFEKGFGLLFIDAVKDLADFPGKPHVPSQGIDISTADSEDLDSLFDLEKQLFNHLLSPPVFRWNDHRPSFESVARALQKETVRYWICRKDGKAVGFSMLDLEEQGGSQLLLDQETAYFRGLYVEPNFRGQGIGSALLNEACTWASQARFTRCAVDLESANDLSRDFLLSRFIPVCYSTIRKLDDRLYGTRTGCF